DEEVVQQAQEVMNRMRSKLGEKVYLNAMHYFGREFWHSSIIYFEAVVNDYGDTEWAPKAIVGMIDAYRKVGFDQEVEQWRQTLLNSYPDSPEAKALMDGPAPDTSAVRR
ncbi:MAG TPA: outer membrane protein assembly factor BamD, partial [Longimicrobiales bacterium]|nr:outer membrane protein assembly factor BamD [Longimicrobiales bacterium]